MTSQPSQPSQPLDEDLAQQEAPPADLPGWAPVSPPPPGPGNPDPIPSGEPADSSQDGTAAASASPRSTRASTSAAVRLAADTIGEAIADIVRGAGETLNKVTAQNDDDDIWLATDKEATAIGDPVGRIIARRLPDLPGGQASDVGDLISAAIPLALYGVRNLARWLPRVRLRRKTVPGQVVAPNMGAAAAPAGAPA